jgi:hypothetical protein
VRNLIINVVSYSLVDRHSVISPLHLVTYWIYGGQFFNRQPLAGYETVLTNVGPRRSGLNRVPLEEGSLSRGNRLIAKAAIGITKLGWLLKYACRGKEPAVPENPPPRRPLLPP